MSTKLIKLSFLTLILFIGSFSLYLIENRKTSGLTEGSYLITGLDVSKINKLAIHYKNEEREHDLVLTKEGVTFYIESDHSYIADTKKVNDLLFNISNIRALKKVSSSKSDHNEYQVTSDNHKYMITFFDKDQVEKVKVYVGKLFKEKGNFLRVEGNDTVFLSEEKVSISLSSNSFVDNRFFTFSYNDINRLDYQGKDNFVILRDGGFFYLEDKGKELSNSQNLKAYSGRIFSLVFNKYYKYDDEVVKNLNFNTKIKYSLTSNINYLVSLAEHDEKYYTKVTSTSNQLPKTIQVSQQADKEQLQKVENLITASSKSQEFNLRHGSWVYEISKRVFDRLKPKTEGFTKKPKEKK